MGYYSQEYVVLYDNIGAGIIGHPYAKESPKSHNINKNEFKMYHRCKYKT